MGDYFFSSNYDPPKAVREHSILDVDEQKEPENGARTRESKRKRQDREQREEEEKEKAALVVVGYECKMFRDPETGASVNEGKFLVPWMGDKTVMIDRYDVRLLLDDRKQFKKVKGKTRTLSKEEAEEEAQCDYERYYDLEHYEEEFEKEEEEKRAKAENLKGFNMVPFIYVDEDASVKGDIETKDSSTKESLSNDRNQTSHNDHFIPSSPVPDSIPLPSTNKHHQVIEHTAKFVAKQGDSVGHALRQKQLNNPNFSFLSEGDRLYPYYIYLLKKSRGISSASSTTQNNSHKKSTSPVPADLPSSPTSTSQNTVPSPSSPTHATSSVSSPQQGSLSVPPPEVKDVIDKLVPFVVKNGKNFEQKVKEKESKNEKFGFLYPWNPYHPYYKQQLEQAISTLPKDNVKPANQHTKSHTSTSTNPPVTSKQTFKPPPEPEVVQAITEFPITPQVPTLAAAISEAKALLPSKEQLKEDRRKKAKMFLQLQNDNTASPTTPPLAVSSQPAVADSATSTNKPQSEVIPSQRPKHNSRSRSRSRGKGKSRDRSPSRSQSRSRDRYRSKRRSRSRDRSTSRRRGRSSYNRHRSRSPSRSRSRSRGRGRGRDKEKSKRSRSSSSSQSSSSSSSSSKSRSRSRSRKRRRHRRR